MSEMQTLEDLQKKTLGVKGCCRSVAKPGKGAVLTLTGAKRSPPGT